MPSPLDKKKYGTEDVMNFYYLQKHLRDAQRSYERAQGLALALKSPELQERAHKLLTGIQDDVQENNSMA